MLLGRLLKCFAICLVAVLAMGVAAQSPAWAQPANNWNRISGAGFPEGVALRTPYSVYLGFGLEGISTALDRATVMDRVLRYLD